MSQRRAFLRIFAAGLVRNLIPYGLASVAAAGLVVGSLFGFDQSPVVGMPPSALALAMVSGSILTFGLALPVSAVLIAFGEWKGFGGVYHVAAGLLSAAVSYAAVVMPQQSEPDYLTLAIVALGGAFGGGVFVGARTVLVRWLGDLGLPFASYPDHP